jgi:hypothetical protein
MTGCFIGIIASSLIRTAKPTNFHPAATIANAEKNVRIAKANWTVGQKQIKTAIRRLAECERNPVAYATGFRSIRRDAMARENENLCVASDVAESLLRSAN